MVDFVASRLTMNKTDYHPASLPVIDGAIETARLKKLAFAALIGCLWIGAPLF